jgi:hypothetical protein
LWLDQIALLTREGKKIRRVRVLDDPPSDYQRWELWAARWHAEAGEQIGYMPRTRTVALGLPQDSDWWLLDDEQLITMRFTEAGEIASKTLSADPGTIARHREWRDLAVRNATAAEEIAAA